MFATLGKLGERMLVRLVPKAKAAAACPPSSRPSGCSWSVCTCAPYGSGLRCTYRCCYNSPPPVSCSNCAYSCIV